MFRRVHIAAKGISPLGQYSCIVLYCIVLYCIVYTARNRTVVVLVVVVVVVVNAQFLAISEVGSAF